MVPQAGSLSPAARCRPSPPGPTFGYAAAMTPPRLRPAELRDADGIGEVHVLAWRAAYRGLMPQAYLDGLQPAVRAERWRTTLSAAQPEGWRMFVAEDASGRIDGFVVVGPSRDEGDAARGIGELMAINLRPEAFGTGAGQALHDAAVDSLAASGWRRAMLKVVAGNARAIRFYERNGWCDAGTSHAIEIAGVAVPERRFERDVPLPRRGEPA